jgi:hypothetical protein
MDERCVVVSNRLDTATAHPARVYDCLLGGKDNFAADREFVERILAVMPSARVAARENRAFMRRVVTWLAGEAGMWQFLDIGTGLPTAPNVHQVAQGIAPHARIVYVDNDPLVLAHARALLTGTPEGVTAYVDADLRDPDRILAEAAQTLDLTRPVALSLVAVLHFIGEDADPYGIVARIVQALPSGSCLALSHGTFDPFNVVQRERMRKLQADSPQPFHPRTRVQVERFFDGLELVEPGIVAVADWRAEGEPSPRPAFDRVAFYGAVARAP